MSDTARSNQNTSRKNGKSSHYNNTVKTPFLSPTHQYMTNKVAEKQAAKSRQVNACRAAQKPKATKTKTYSYKNFWNRKDGFFSGRWWQDPDKMDEAYRMLQEELRAKKRINLVDLSVNNEGLKILFLQELVNGNVKDGYGDALLNAMQNGLVAVGLDISPYEISPRSLYELKKRYDKNPYKNANHAMQNGWGDIADGILMLGFGVAYSWSDSFYNNTFTEKTTGKSSIDPYEIRYSQSSVNGTKKIIQSMKKNGWKGEPIDIVEMPDGKYTTIDNTRVAAARVSKIEVEANIHKYTDPLPSKYIDRFTTKKGIPKTWGDAIELRIGKQKVAFREKYPYGSLKMEKIK